eukprot:g6253.t1
MGEDAGYAQYGYEPELVDPTVVGEDGRPLLVFGDDGGGGGGSGGTEGDAPAAPELRKRLPEHATSEEVLEVVKNAVWQLGRALGARRKRNLKVGDFDGDGDVDEDDYEARLLDDVYQCFARLERNGAKWLTSGHDDPSRRPLTRMKFDGGVKVILGLDLRWQQFDALFRTLSTNGDGTIQPSEWRRAFSRKTTYSELRRAVTRTGNDAGDMRSGGAHRRRRPEGGTHGRGAHRAGTSDEQQQLRDALFAICDTLEGTRTTLKQAFDAYDRNGSGTISVSEFTSLMRSLGGLGLTKRQIYHLVNACDENFDRSVTWPEFMQFFLVVWVQRLAEMKQRLGSSSSGSGSGSSSSSNRRRQHQLAMIQRGERAARRVFGPDYLDLVDDMNRRAGGGGGGGAGHVGALIPGPFSSVLRSMDMGPDALSESLMPISPPRANRGATPMNRNRKKNKMAAVPTRPQSSPVRPGKKGGGGVAVAGAGAVGPRPGPRGAGVDPTIAGRNELVRMRLAREIALREVHLRAKRNKELQQAGLSMLPITAAVVVPKHVNTLI